MDPIKFADDVPSIYRELEPSLIALAHRYKAPNPRDTVRAWLSRAYEIVARFDAGALQKKVYAAEDTQEELISFDPAIHVRADFIRSLKNYLKRSFTNEILKFHKASRRSQERPDDVAVGTTSQFSKVGFAESGNGLFRYDAITIDFLLKIIELDHARARRGSQSITELVQERFLWALLCYCRSIKERGDPWDKLVVVPNVDAVDHKKYFSVDFRIDLEDGVRRELAKLIVTETNPIVIERLGVLINLQQKGTLQKRLFRYFFEHHRGFPERLKARIRNRTL